MPESDHDAVIAIASVVHGAPPASIARPLDFVRGFARAFGLGRFRGP